MMGRSVGEISKDKRIVPYISVLRKDAGFFIRR